MADSGDHDDFKLTAEEGDDATEASRTEDGVDVSAEFDIGVEDPELEAIKARVKEMEEEAEKLKELQKEVEEQMNHSSSASNASLTVEEKKEVDARSIFVGNVDYGATAEELEAHFHGCGSVNRVTILCDKFSGHPKGFAYVEFADKDSVETAKALDDSLFRGRQIKVMIKRTNVPGRSSTNRPPRGYRGGGGGGGGYFRRGGGYRQPPPPSYGGGYGYPPPRRFYRGGYRPRRPWYAPY